MFMSPISTALVGGECACCTGSGCSAIGCSLAGAGLNAVAMLRLDAEEIVDMRLNNRLFLDSFLSSILPSGLIPLSEISLAERERATSLPRRLPFDPLWIESRLGEPRKDSPLWSVQVEEVEGAVVCLLIGGFLDGGGNFSEVRCSTFRGL